METASYRYLGKRHGNAEAVATAIHGFWRALHPGDAESPQAAGGEWRGIGRAEGAALRRCVHPADAFGNPAFFLLADQMQRLGAAAACFKAPEEHYAAWALVAILLAHLKANVSGEESVKSFAAQLGAPRADGQPRCSEVRFQRLQSASDEGDFLRQAIRALSLIDHRCNAVRLADDLIGWQHDFYYGKTKKPRDRLKLRWAIDYFGAHHAPSATASKSGKTAKQEGEAQ